jgi:hypothetical protein
MQADSLNDGNAEPAEHAENLVSAVSACSALIVVSAAALGQPPASVRVDRALARRATERLRALQREPIASLRMSTLP